MKKIYISIFLVITLILAGQGHAQAKKNESSLISNIKQGIINAIETYNSKKKLVQVRKHYPKMAKFWPEIEKSGKKFGVDPLLIAATIKQESNFNPKAVSYMNAIGIAQIIPPTAKLIAKKHNIKEYDLFNYKDNIYMSAAYLSDMQELFNQPKYDHYMIVQGRHYKKPLVYTIASYNAGPGNASRWYKIRETRKYVPKVLKNYREYTKKLG